MKPHYFLMLVLLVVPGVSGADFQEGVQYIRLASPGAVETGDKIEVREFFWYGCPHCYTLEPTIESWIKRMPANAEFVRTPGVALRWMVHAQAFYAFESIGVLEKLHKPFFDAIHRERRPLDNEDSIAAFVTERGLDSDAFRRAFNSFGVRLKVDRAKKLNIEYGVSSVPALIVDGKYLTAPSMAGREETTMQVVDFLIKKAAAERKNKRTGR
jgi:thiol:disulfide interchange protein DsbA